MEDIKNSDPLGVAKDGNSVTKPIEEVVAEKPDAEYLRNKLFDQLLAGIKLDLLKIAFRIHQSKNGKDFFSICSVNEMKVRISALLKMKGIETNPYEVEDDDFKVVESLHCQKLSDFKDDSIMFIASVIARNTGIDGEIGDFLFGENKPGIVDSYYEMIVNGQLEWSASLAPLNIPSAMCKKPDAISPTLVNRVAIGLATTFTLGLWIGYLLGSHFPF
ncbi:hypothetical protein D3C87_686700 [compost metagenome]